MLYDNIQHDSYMTWLAFKTELSIVYMYMTAVRYKRKFGTH